MKLLLMVLLLYSSYLQSKPIKVVYIPAGKTGYWGSTAIPLPNVAKQLGLDLTITPARLMKEDYISEIKRVVESGNKPDWIIWTQRRIDPVIVLELFKKHHIKSIDITSGFLDFDIKKIGYPQQYYPNWIAQVMSDEFQGGQMLAEQLIVQRQQMVPNQPVKMIAIAGDRATKAAQHTIYGLESSFNNQDNAQLIQTVYSSWKKDIASQMTEKLFARHSRLDAIWSANTAIAMGIAEQLNKINFASYPKPILGSLGWDDKIFQAIKKNQLQLSFGGNHLNAMWALILIHDHEHGKPIEPTPESTLFSIPYIKVDKDNVEKIIPTFTEKYWETVDIKQFSKVYNQKIKNYHFDFSILLMPDQ